MAGRQYENSGMRQTVRPVVTGVVVGMIASIVLLFLFSAWMTFQDTPQALVDPFAVFALSVGALLAGLVCTRITRSGGLIYGALCGMALSLVVIVAGLVTGAGGVGVPGVFRVVFIMLCAMIGGVTGVNMRKRPGR